MSPGAVRAELSLLPKPTHTTATKFLLPVVIAGGLMVAEEPFACELVAVSSSGVDPERRILRNTFIEAAEALLLLALTVKVTAESPEAQIL